MKFLQKYSENALRIVITIITIYCLVIIAIPFIRATITNKLILDDTVKNEIVTKDGTRIIVLNVIPGGNAEKAGLKPNDIILALNGIPCSNIAFLQELLSKSDVRFPAIYTIQRGADIFDIPVQIYKYFHLLFYIFFALGLGFLIIGFFVGISRPKELTSQIFFLFCAASSIGFLNQGGVYYYTGTSTYLSYNYFISNIFLYPLFFHFFSIYPLKYNFKNRKIKIFSVYLYAVLLALPAFVPEYFPFLSVDLIRQFFFAYIPSLFVIISLILFFNSYRKIKNVELKKALRVLIIGLIIGFIGFIYFYLIFNSIFPLAGMQPIYRIPTLLILAIPLSFGYSIYKYRILDTEFFVKRGIVFTAATIITIIAYLGAINILETFFEYYNLKNKQFITVITIILVIFSFSYITKLIKAFVDKKFYKTRYNYRKALLELSEELPYLNNIEEVSIKLQQMLQKTIGIEYFDIWIKEKIYKPGKKCKTYDLKDEIMNSIYEKKSDAVTMSDITFTELELPDTYKQIIRDNRIALTIPIFLKDKLIGAINLGEKPEKSPYTEEDIDLLKTISSNISIVFENSRLRLEEIEKNKIEEELKIARRIQEGLLPEKHFNFGKIEISCAFFPARIIGGDFYDIIRIDEKNVLIVIADVSGKGLPAAIYMAKVQSLIRFASKLFYEPKEILKEVNKQIYKNFSRNSFVTLSLGLINLDSYTLKFIRAGHNPAIFSNNGNVQLLNTKGMGLGLDSNNIFYDYLSEQTIELKDNSFMLFYTDGLNEAMNKEREEFGLEKLINFVHINKNHKPSIFNKNLMNEVNQFTDGAEQNDDITLVTLKVNKV